MKVLKNIKVLKKGAIEEFLKVEIRYDDTEVFTDLPIAVVEYGDEMVEPYLFRVESGFAILIEGEQLRELLKTQKVFFFKVNENKTVEEVEEGKHDVNVRLPIDTKVEELMYDNNEIVWVDKRKEEDIDG